MTEQEYQVNKILPSIRKRMAKQLVETGKNQKDIAKMLGLTEGAISQYVNDRRGNLYKLNNKQKPIIDHYVKKIMIGKDPFVAQSRCLSGVFKFDKKNTPN